MAKANTISPSQLDAMSCRLAWYLGYKLGYSSKRSSSALEFGTAIHYALEIYYSKKGDPLKAFTKWIDDRIREMNEDDASAADELFDMKNLGVGMLEGYFREYEGEDDFDVLATELFMTRPLTPPTNKDPDPGCSISVRLDGLVRDHQTEKLFSLEHKTFSSFSPSFMDLDHQMTAQVFVAQEAAKEKGIEGEVYGVIYNGLRKQLPSPKVRNRLFERHKIYRNQRQLDVFTHRAYHQYMECQGKPAIYPQPNMIRCSQCDFRSICTAYMLGEDWRYLLEETYTRKKR